MKAVKSMTDDEFRDNVRMAAHMFAQRKYQEANPGASRADAWTYATRNWNQFVETALDWMAVCEAEREAREAAPWN